MNIIENFSSKIINSLEKDDIKSYRHYREELIIRIANQDFFSLEEIESHFTVGKALALILDDMYKTPPLLYKRIVLCAVYCLLKTIINDKDDKEGCTTYASALLYILFSENEDFIGGEYLMPKFGNNAETTSYQFIGMQSVFYWKYKLSSCNTHFPPRIEQRLANSVSPTSSKIPDESNRKKIIDFEYKNFSALLTSIPIDIEMKYRGIFIDPLDTDTFTRLKSIFKQDSYNFSKKETQVMDNTGTSINQQKGTKKGCMALIFICITFTIILSVIS